MDAPRRSNCLIWAVYRWLTRGGHIRIRRSLHHAWLPHFMWSSTGRYWWAYSPIRPCEGWRALLDSPRFVGRVEMEK